MKRIALRHLAKTDHRIYSKMIHMSLLDVRNLTVDLPTAAGWIRPVNDVSFQLAPAESLGLPKLLIADEPTTALDVTVQKQILDLLDRLRRELKLGLVFITHDLGVVAQVADRIAVMYAGRIAEEGPAADVLRAPRHPYTQGLLAASPSLEKRKLTPIPGTVPQLVALPPGCAFEPRCELRRSECTAAVPELRSASAHHAARCGLRAGLRLPAGMRFATEAQRPQRDCRESRDCPVDAFGMRQTPPPGCFRKRGCNCLQAKELTLAG